MALNGWTLAPGRLGEAPHAALPAQAGVARVDAPGPAAGRRGRARAMACPVAGGALEPVGRG